MKQAKKIGKYRNRTTKTMAQYISEFIEQSQFTESVIPHTFRLTSQSQSRTKIRETITSLGENKQYISYWRFWFRHLKVRNPLAVNAFQLKANLNRLQRNAVALLNSLYDNHF